MKIKKIRIISATPYTDVTPDYVARIGQETLVIDDNSLYYGKMANPECDEKGVQTTGLMIQVCDYEVLQEVELSKSPNGEMEELLRRIYAKDQANIGEKFKDKEKKKGVKKTVREKVMGDDYSRKLERNVNLKRIIDRENDDYLEKVTDPQTGETIHYCHEPLSEHIGHGSDRKE